MKSAHGKKVRTTCPYCGVGCGVVVSVAPDGQIKVAGDPHHPANYGRLCSKGAALADTLGLEARALQPRVRGQACDWDHALDAVADGLGHVIREHGPDAVAFYVSGQLLTEDYYVANKLMKGFIGSANIDTNSRLCMSSAVAGHVRAFGADTVPCAYEDLELADLVVLAGSNAAWCHPVLFQRLSAAKKRRPELKVVVIDPRRTATCDVADLHLPLRPGADVMLFNGLLRHLDAAGKRDEVFVRDHTEGFDAALEAARLDAPDVAAVAEACGLEAESVAAFYELFAGHERVVTAFSQGVNQSTSGTDKVNAIINCHLLTGRIGRPGMGPFSLTGQPNAMGGREVGGLANQLAAHLQLEQAEHRDLVQRFWGAPTMAARPGHKAVDLFREIERGSIKAVWIMATNPVVSLPDADRARSALAGCELVVVSDCVSQTDTTVLADVLLPATTWGEKDGTVTNSERRISRQRAFLPAAGEAQPDWWIISQVARRMGFGEGFRYQSAAEIFREHAALTALANAGSRDLDLGAMVDIDDAGYKGLEPLQWPAPMGRPGGTARLFGDGRFFTDSGRARFQAVRARPPAHPTSSEYPLVLNTGRIRDQWHTMTRTGCSARLSSHLSEPFVDVNPADALAANLIDGALAELRSAWGSMLARVRVSEGQSPGAVFVPMHWNGRFASLGRVGALVNPAVDPVSGEPEFKHTPVRIAPYAAAWHGFALVRRPFTPVGPRYWTRRRIAGGWCYELAGERMADWPGTARGWLGGGGDWIEFSDAAMGRYRGALLIDGRVEACLFTAAGDGLPSREWLESLLQVAALTEEQRAGLLAGQAPGGAVERGKVVCACFGVGENDIVEAIQRDDLGSVEAIGAMLKAGTNCGSCVPELRALLARARKQQAA